MFGKLAHDATEEMLYFLLWQKYMPELASLFSHVLVDVSSVKALCLRWYPKGNTDLCAYLITTSSYKIFCGFDTK